MCLRRKNKKKRSENKNNDNEIDLSNAFKNSNAKSQDEGQQSAQSFSPGTPKFVQWVIKYSGGLIKSEAQAQYVLLAFSALAIIVSLFLFFKASGGIRIKNQAPTGGLEEEAGSPADIAP